MSFDRNSQPANADTRQGIEARRSRGGSSSPELPNPRISAQIPSFARVAEALGITKPPQIVVSRFTAGLASSYTTAIVASSTQKMQFTSFHSYCCHFCPNEPFEEFLGVLESSGSPLYTSVRVLCFFLSELHLQSKTKPLGVCIK